MYDCYRACLILTFFMSISGRTTSIDGSTNKTVTAVLGRNISLPCNYPQDTKPDAVYWYKHANIGEPDDKKIVARYYQGLATSVEGFERFALASNHSLMIYNVSILDETTYSYLVVNHKTHRGNVDLRVIALGELSVESCNVTGQGRCTYTIEEDSPDQIGIVCKVTNVRAPAYLTWTSRDGTLQETAVEPQINQNGGLCTMSSKLLISRSHVKDEYVCHAKGEAVNETFSMAIAIDIKQDSIYRGLGPGWNFVTIENSLLLLLVLVLVICYMRYGLPSWLSRGGRELNDANSSHRDEYVEKKRDKVKGRSEEENQSQESDWEEGRVDFLQQSFGELDFENREQLRIEIRR